MTSGPERTVVVAPTAFKGTLGPRAVARAMRVGVAAVWPGARIVERPLSDGGNGLLEACAALLSGSLESHTVTGPLGEPVTARLLRSDRRAVVESAEACGLHLIPVDRRDPCLATTRGVGELLRIAAERGASEVILGLGGSGTVDGGSGMARALGWRFLDAGGAPLPEGGGSLEVLADLVPPAERFRARVVALCDVDNPLTGVRGAARVYGPQKGAGPDGVERLERGLVRLAALIRRRLGLQVEGLPRSGAAGGLGAGARAFLGAELVSGAEWMIELAGLPKLLAEADLLVTGEGRYDAQSGMGKLTGRLLEAAAAAGVARALVAGRIEGPAPPGTEVVDGGDAVLAEEDIAELAEAACRRLARRDRL